MVVETTAPFYIDEYLETEEDISDFLKGTLDTGSISDFINALNIAARAHGMTQIAKEAGVARASLYKTLSEEGNPEFDTIVKVLKTLGCRFSVVADTLSVSESGEAVETVADDRATVC